MRWGESAFRWVRPLHGILALFDGVALGGTVEPAADRRYVFERSHPGATASWRRHRSTVTSFADYRDKLRAAYVILDRADRKTMITGPRPKNWPRPQGLHADRDDPALLDEVAGLVEWPVVYAGASTRPSWTCPTRS